MNITHVKKVLPLLAKSGLTVNLIGGHGIGKTEIVKDVADQINYQLVSFRVGQVVDQGDIIGLPIIVDKNLNADVKKYSQELVTKFITPEVFPKKLEEGKDGIIVFFDEINRASNTGLLQCLFELFERGRMNNYELPTKNYFIVTAMNPATEDFIVSDFSDAAFQSRMLHLEVTSSPEDLRNYTKGKKELNLLNEFIKENALLVEFKIPSFSISDMIKPCNRSMVKLAKLHDEETIPKEYQLEVYTGLVGNTLATAWINYAKTKSERLKGKDLVKSLHKNPNALETLKKLTEDGSMDILGVIREEIEEYGIKNFSKMDEQEVDNLSVVLQTIPKDLGFTAFYNIMFKTAVGKKEPDDANLPIIRLTFNTRSLGGNGVMDYFMDSMKEISKNKEE